MKKNCLFTLLLFVAIAPGFSQNFKDGFIVTRPAGDTIRGKIRYKESSARFKQCVFQAPGEEAKTFLPADIAGYTINGEYTFVSRKVEIKGSMVDAFAEVYVLGKASLISVDDLYFLDINNGTFPLLEIKETVMQNGSAYVTTNKQYRKTLAANMQDCPRAAGSAADIPFSAPQMAKVVNQYNECFGGSATPIQSSKKWAKVYLGLSGGMTSSTFIGFETTSLAPYIDPKQFSKDLFYYPGLSFEVYSPRTTEKLHFHVDLFFQQNSLVSTLPGRNISLTYSSLNIPIGASLTLVQTAAVRGFMEGGFSIYRQSNQKFNGANVSVDVTRNGTVNFYGGLGVSTELPSKFKFQGRVRYEQGEFHLDESSPAIKKRNLVVLVSVLYNLSKK